MKILRFDMVGGASGDMILAGLIGLGVDPDMLNRDIDALCPGEHLHIHHECVNRDGLTGISARVMAGHHEADHHHHHHGHHGHHHHEHHHRTMANIRVMIEGSSLTEKTKSLSLKVFQHLAEAEGRVHGKPADEVHFHEVGALDSIADIVGICRAFELLGVDAITVGPFPAGHGTIHCQHGEMPNPAPAAMQLLGGQIITAVDEPFELVTPTAAAVLTALPRADHLPDAMVRQSVNAFGHRKLNGRPNLLRVTALEAQDKPPRTNHCVTLECDIDDLPAENLGYLSERLFDVGALDVVMIPTLMKKQRPGIRLSVLVDRGDEFSIAQLIFRETSTFGLRINTVERIVLDREIIVVPTPYGDIDIKIGSLQGETMSASPEYESCKAAALKHGVPLKDVQQSARTAYEQRK